MKTKVAGLIMAGALLLSSPIQAVYANTPEVVEAIKAISNYSEHWANDAINKMYEKNAFLYEDQNLGYDIEIKKSEFAKMLCIALDIKMNYISEPDIKDYFDDIEPTEPYASYVIDLVNANVFEGEGSFNPEDNIKREEMIEYFMRAYNYKMGDSYKMMKLEAPNFADADKITAEYIGNISQAQHYKIIFGNTDNMFEPQRTASIAEAATVAVRVSAILDSQNLKFTVNPEVIVGDNSMEMKITIKNDSKDDVFIEHMSGQKYEFELLDAENSVLWNWSANKRFMFMLTTTELKAGETLEFSDIISGNEYLSIKDKIVYFKGYITGTADFIDPQGYEIELNK